ncbi:MAG: aldolase/citrate lyase family protein [SAR202 cluster bacterium]|nr:aldolase/citrate lyase family protein [SAR202 cluster bacterium]
MSKFFKIIDSKSFILNGWLSIPNSFTAEAMNKMGWDSITIDMQHGQNDYHTSISMLQAINNSNTVPFVRIPWNEPGIIMRMLDLGVLGVIAPMINTKKEGEDFVSYCNYPPKGQRSFGPMRAQLIYGSDYYDNANDQIISLAMIETKEAVDNIDEILSIPNLTGVYIGPGDMSSSYGLKPQFDIKDGPVYSNIKMIAKKAKENGKIASIHNGTTKYAKEMIKLGYQFVTVSSDFRSMSTHAQNIVNEMKNAEKGKTSSSTY